MGEYPGSKPMLVRRWKLATRWTLDELVVPTLVQQRTNVEQKFVFVVETRWKKMLEQCWINVGQNFNVGIQLLV